MHLAYEAYCGELKDQLEIVKLENEVLRRERRKDTGEYPALALLTSMTSLSVSCVYAGVTQRYSCGVLDGVLKGITMTLTLHSTGFCGYLLTGHSFILTRDQNVKAYTYDPSGSELKNFKQVAYDLADKIVFPEHMLSRFLINLLHTNYKNHDCS